MEEQTEETAPIEVQNEEIAITEETPSNNEETHVETTVEGETNATEETTEEDQNKNEENVVLEEGEANDEPKLDETQEPCEEKAEKEESDEPVEVGAEEGDNVEEEAPNAEEIDVEQSEKTEDVDAVEETSDSKLDEEKVEIGVEQVEGTIRCPKNWYKKKKRTELLTFNFGEDEGEDDLSDKPEEIKATLDRKPYYKKYEELSAEIEKKRTRNNLLQSKMAVIFKRRRMGHVLREGSMVYDTLTSYATKLDHYGEVLDIYESQVALVTENINDAKETRTKKERMFKEMFERLQKREMDTGRGLIHTKTGNPIPDKVVERLVHRQRLEMGQVCGMRLQFIKLRDMIQETEEATERISKISENFGLVDYEILKAENRNYTSKIEEREEELTKLRAKCQSTIQTLAHLREKSAAMSEDVLELERELEEASTRYVQKRTQLASIKADKTLTQQHIYKLQQNSGLLTYPDLLRDMKDSMEELQQCRVQLEDLKELHASRCEEVRNIRKRISRLTSKMKGKGRRKGRTSLRSGVWVKEEESKELMDGMDRYKPVRFVPNLDANVFEHLTKIKPMVTGVEWRRNRKSFVLSKKKGK